MHGYSSSLGDFLTIFHNAVVKSQDIPICKLLAKCREMISLVDFL